MSRKKKAEQEPTDESSTATATATAEPDTDQPEGGAGAGADSGKPKREADERIKAEREELIRKIMQAMALEQWGNHPLTREFVVHLEQKVESEARHMQEQLVSGDKPVSGADQMKFRGRRGALLAVHAQMQQAARATLDAIEEARRYEDSLADELAMNYPLPEWDSYEEEARKRMGDDEPQFEGMFGDTKPDNADDTGDDDTGSDD